MGYSPEDIISNIFRVCKNLELREHAKLYFLKVSVFNSKYSKYFREKLTKMVLYRKLELLTCGLSKVRVHSYK